MGLQRFGYSAAGTVVAGQRKRQLQSSEFPVVQGGKAASRSAGKDAGAVNQAALATKEAARAREFSRSCVGKPSDGSLLNVEAFGESFGRQLTAKLHTWLQAAREEERVWIARELHDEMGGTLAAIKVTIAMLEARPGRRSSEAADFLVPKLHGLVDAAFQAMHGLVAQLRPPALLDELGLQQAIKAHIHDFQEQTGLPCQLTMPDDGFALDPVRSIAVFRVLQESLTNVAKHAQASKVHITLRKVGHELVLKVHDDGKGFVPRSCKDGTFGLQGIRERAALAEGRASILSSPNKGTKVALRIPLD